MSAAGTDRLDGSPGQELYLRLFPPSQTAQPIKTAGPPSWQGYRPQFESRRSMPVGPAINTTPALHQTCGSRSQAMQTGPEQPRHVQFDSILLGARSHLCQNNDIHKAVKTEWMRPAKRPGVAKVTKWNTDSMDMSDDHRWAKWLLPCSSLL